MKLVATTAALVLALSTSFAVAGGDGYGVIAAPMSTSSTASTGAGIGETNPGKTQLAAQLGLNAVEYTTAELTRIQVALENGDFDQANYVIEHTNRKPVDVAPQPVMGRDA